MSVKTIKDATGRKLRNKGTKTEDIKYIFLGPYLASVRIDQKQTLLYASATKIRKTKPSVVYPSYYFYNAKFSVNTFAYRILSPLCMRILFSFNCLFSTIKFKQYQIKTDFKTKFNHVFINIATNICRGVTKGVLPFPLTLVNRS